MKGMWNFTQLERMEQRTVFDPETGCQLWVGAMRRDGYGEVRVSGRTDLVHRFMWEEKCGPIPDGLVLDHICRNRRCCRIEHLRLVTRWENTIRNSVGTAAKNAAKTNCPKCGAAYFVQGNGGRRCRECKNAYERGYYAERMKQGNWRKRLTTKETPR